MNKHLKRYFRCLGLEVGAAVIAPISYPLVQAYSFRCMAKDLGNSQKVQNICEVVGMVSGALFIPFAGVNLLVSPVWCAVKVGIAAVNDKIPKTLRQTSNEITNFIMEE
jgi:hypothetical protein